jgi:hypothetical protein
VNCREVVLLFATLTTLVLLAFALELELETAVALELELAALLDTAAWENPKVAVASKNANRIIVPFVFFMSSSGILWLVLLTSRPTQLAQATVEWRRVSPRIKPLSYSIDKVRQPSFL